MRTIKLFINEYKTQYNEVTLKYSAGEICKDGYITNQQAGAEETFAIGMPVYGMDNEEIGRLSIGLFDGLNYNTNSKIKIPVETWRIDGYKGDRQRIKTFYQVNHLSH